ncbi:hypothetical protein ACIGNX_22465 [Actinosynnema sp. NPDC053489]|uniref:hypothetical protein n=1 Tax=Actinosynnema sp. NPDC053489 TaxID=3363916 RepID=UPI0037CBF0C8
MTAPDGWSPGDRAPGEWSPGDWAPTGGPDPFRTEDVVLRLVVEGRIALEPAEADRVIGELERTLDAVAERMRVVDLLRGTTLADLRRIHPDVERAVVDAVFAEQVGGGRLRWALDALPKYIKALEEAKKPRLDRLRPHGR